ncbi:MAG: divalent-cation tolerance protein CutA, partial [Dehalococcoidales bacterium]|nr:divalent-cation tolerance protein CutA [Dehalococcoidales bacterium]
MSAVSSVVVFITAATEAEAHRIAEFLLTQKKAACVNIVPGVDSHFWWQGKLDSAQERLLIVKTIAALLPEIIDF